MIFFMILKFIFQNFITVDIEKTLFIPGIYAILKGV